MVAEGTSRLSPDSFPSFEGGVRQRQTMRDRCKMRAQHPVVFYIPYSGFLSREKTVANCMLENRISQRKRSQVCGNPVHHAH